MTSTASDPRSLGLLATTGIGVGAIVGGGVLVLTGVAFATTGPSAILAFALNGLIALLTALSFGELGARFPESGGTYTYARKVLTIETAFAVGWVVWFASVVAAVFYALGFAVFFHPLLAQMLSLVGLDPPGWIGARFALVGYALAAVGLYAAHLLRAGAGGRQWATIGKVVVFAAMILGGLAALANDPPAPDLLRARFSPFFSDGLSGLVQAMGYTFIAWQGFALVAAVGGEVRDPERNIRRAMLLSVAAAAAIYLPLLLLIVALTPTDTGIAITARDAPEILVATAARAFLGAAGYWLVVVAGVLSMLSAMQANLVAASSFARTMAADRTLPRVFEGTPSEGGVPGAAIKVTTAAVAAVLIAVPSVAGAGAASSLIFLVTFAGVHGIAYLARRRGQRGPQSHRALPLVPVLGAAGCTALALYQALAVPSAGVLVALWLSAGAVLYVTHLAPRARAVDASSEGLDPQLIRLRGRTPVVLVPIANPDSAETMVKVAEAIAPRGVSRIQLLTVIPSSGGSAKGDAPPPLLDAQRILGGALSTALASDLRPEALVTIHDDPWSEIERIAEQTRCETLLLGVGQLGRALMSGPLERLMTRIPADVVVLRAPSGWDPDQARRILVPSRGGREQSPIRARLLGSLARTASREATFLWIRPTSTVDAELRRAQTVLGRLARDEVGGAGTAVVVQRDDAVAEVVERAAACDLLILGLTAQGRQRAFGEHSLAIAEATRCPLLLISHHA